MFLQIETYISKSREERRSHLDLSDPCIMIGGGSRDFRGLLAHYLKTTVPAGRDVVLCHACHNGRCSNPKHIYWGTQRDNFLDQVDNGTTDSIKTRMINRYGEEGYRKIVAEATRKAREVSRKVNKLTLPEWERIKQMISSVPDGRGKISKLSVLLGVSHTQVRRYMKHLGLVK